MNTLKQIRVISDIEPLNELSMDDIKGGRGGSACCFLNGDCNDNTQKALAQK